MRAWVMAYLVFVLAVTACAVMALTGCAKLGGWIDAVPWPTNDVPPVVTTTTIPPAATTTTQPPAPVEGLTFKLHSPKHNYVNWGKADRTGWPSHVVNDKTCDGLLFGAPVGQPTRKIEHVVRGRENTGIVNAIEHGKYYQGGWVPGTVIQLELRDISGKLRNPAYVGTVVYK